MTLDTMVPSSCSPRAWTPTTPSGPSAARSRRTCGTGPMSRRPPPPRRTRAPWPGSWPGSPACWPASRSPSPCWTPPGSRRSPPSRCARTATGSRPGPRCCASRAPLRELLGAERTLLNFLTHLSGHRHRHPGLGRRAVRYRVRGARHPQDHPGAAPAGEVRGALRRRPQPPDGTRRRRADQGQPRGGGRRDRRGDRGRARGRARRCRSRWSATPWTRSARRWTAGAGAHPARQHGPGRPARGRRPGPPLPRVRLEASGGLRLEAARAVAETGVDFVAVGALTHSSPALDLGLDLVGG